MVNIQDVCDYIIFRVTGEGNGMLSHLKLQKILYYIQSWNLAFEKEPLFEGKFQAWIHGPVNRDVYNRFKDTKYIYSAIDMTDIKQDDLNFTNLDQKVKDHIDSVLEAYLPFGDIQLEKMTHREDPWVEARNGFEPFERCEVEINEATMKNYYTARLGK